MAFKFPNILKAMGMGSDKEAVTDAHLQAADTTIAQLEQAKTDAEGKLATAEGNLKTALEEKTKVEGDLSKEKEKTATLQQWKDNQQATDKRTEDDSNKLEGQPQGRAAWQVAAQTAIDSAKRRVGEDK